MTTLVLNQEFNGIEIKFDRKPLQATLDELKKPGYFQDEAKAKEHCYFKLSSFADAHRCTGSEIETYESWYY